jgi:hypothetical protein
MSGKYFDKFPIITYANNQVVDITKRTALLESISANSYALYSYEIDSNERADQLSYRYYDDQYKSWILYFSNKIMDPYYEWYLSDNELVDFVVKKYNSYYDAQTKIKYYKNNWYDAEDINVSTYDALPANMKEYWEPNISGTKTLGYKRREINWTVNTNKVIQYTVSQGNNFIKDEICNIVFDEYNYGRAQVLSKFDNKVYLQHVSGVFYVNEEVSITSNSYIYGTESKANVVFTDVLAVANNIEEEELIYWNPITYLEYENEKNEFNKTIRVLESNLKQTMVDNLTELMSE